MKALTYIEHGKFALTDKPKPEILDPRDAIVRVTLGSNPFWISPSIYLLPHESADVWVFRWRGEALLHIQDRLSFSCKPCHI